MAAHNMIRMSTRRFKSEFHASHSTVTTGLHTIHTIQFIKIHATNMHASVVNI